MKPRIGFTTRNFSLDPLQLATRVSIWLAGGVPVRLRPKAPRYGERIDGLVIGGGTDLYPALHKNDPIAGHKYDQARDEMEIKWLEQADDRGLPVLGICRGAQLINVRRGGTLHIDVAKIYEDAKYPSHILANIFYRKTILLEPDTLLRRLLCTDQTRVNSMHSQAIDQTGDNLVISAKERNGVVQAVEDPARDFYVGVQFHPEALIHRAKFRNIFKTLVQTAMR